MGLVIQSAVINPNGNHISIAFFNSAAAGINPVSPEQPTGFSFTVNGNSGNDFLASSYINGLNDQSIDFFSDTLFRIRDAVTIQVSGTNLQDSLSSPLPDYSAFAAVNGSTVPALNPGNPYCDYATFFDLYDIRQMGMLSRDDNLRSPLQVRVQKLLDMQASRLDSYLAGRWSLPLGGTTRWDVANGTMPGAFTIWVASHTAERSYLRRSDLPQAVKDDLKESDEWLKDLLMGVATIADTTGAPLDRSTIATLDSSDFTDGRSRFDNRRDLFPPASPTGPSRGT